MSFSKDFIWGTASAAYQIEGAYNEDGKGMGTWDSLSKGHVLHGDNGNVACDHYHRYKEDIAIMKKMGVKAYRFSVSWPRIFPEEGKINPKGIEFYRNVVEECKANGIEPMCTIFHWNLPMWIHEKGGWDCPEISNYFEEYTKAVVQALSDKVQYWMTINEPACFIGMGHAIGEHAPFECHIEDEKYMAEVYPRLCRNTLLCHGKAVKAIRENAVLEPKVGMALNGKIITPKNDSAEEIEKAREMTFRLKDYGYLFAYNLWADPMILGKIPETLKNVLNQDDIKVINQKLDFFGFNTYNSNNYWEMDPKAGDNPDVITGMPRTNMGWPITPDVIYWNLRFMHERYGLPLLVTENGMANIDFVMSDGKVHDPQRIEYIKAYLTQAKKAVDEGIPMLGYMYWSILDNFEWAWGYDKRFGLVYVDYQTQKRTLKDSAYYYSEVIASNGEKL